MTDLTLRELLPPQSLEAEQSVLGACVLDRAAVETALDLLEPTDFYREAHRWIFEAVQDLAGRNEPADLVTLQNLLRDRQQLDLVGGVSYLANLADIVPTTANTAFYANIVRDKAILRRLVETGERLRHLGYTADDATAALDIAEADVLAIGQRSAAGSDSHERQVDETERLLKTGVFGEDWEMPCLNATAGPIPDEAPTVVGGKSGHGKSWFVVGETIGKCRKGLGVLGFSMEMRSSQIHQRILSHLTGIPMRALRAGAKHPATSWVKDGTLARALSDLRSWPLVIDDRGSLTVEQMAARIRRVKRDMERSGGRLALVWIDQASFIAVHGRRMDSEYSRSKAASDGVREMVKALRVPTIVLTQVTDESNSTRKGGPRDPTQFPRVHTRDAKDWYNDAGCVIWLHRPAVDMPQGGGNWTQWRDKALVWVNKGRMEGGEGQMTIGWNSTLGGFLDPGNAVKETTPSLYQMAQAPAPEPEELEYEYGDPFAEDDE